MAGIGGPDMKGKPMESPNNPLAGMRVTIGQLERLIQRTRADLATAELLLLTAKAEFCQYPPLKPPEEYRDAD